MYHNQDRARLISMLQNVNQSPLPESTSEIGECMNMDRIAELAERVLIGQNGQLNYENVQWLESNGFQVTVPVADAHGPITTQMWTRKGYFLI